VAQLFQHKVSAVYIPGFYPPLAAARLAQRLVSDEKRIMEWKVSSGRGLESSDVRTVGMMPYNMVASSQDDKAVDEYFKEALPAMRELRVSEHGEPVLSPLDKLRLELDEIWPQGATLTKSRDGRPFVAGLTRVMVRQLRTIRRSMGMVTKGVTGDVV
jgi:hypothetical protein